MAPSRGPRRPRRPAHVEASWCRAKFTIATLMASLPTNAATSVAMVEEAKLLPNSGHERARDFGVSVALWGETAVVGTSLDQLSGAWENTTYVLKRAGTSWAQEAVLAEGANDENNVYFTSVAISGDTLVVGASGPFDRSRMGAAFVYVRIGAGWSKQADLTSSDPAVGDLFGFSVAVDGDVALVGAPGYAASKGAAHLFVRNGTAWLHETILGADPGAPGDNFGRAVALSGSNALVGAPWQGVANSRRGKAYAFTNASGNWSLKQSLQGHDTGEFDEFGISVALKASKAFVGAIGNENGAGAVYHFSDTTGVWRQDYKMMAPQITSADNYGTSVSFTDELLVIGASGDAHAGPRSGAAHLYNFNGAFWIHQRKLMAADTVAGDYFGYSTAVHGDIAVIGATGSDSGRGAAYVFAWASCRRSNCGEGFVLKSPPPDRCQGNTCTQQQCCDAADICVVDDCNASLGFIMKNETMIYCDSTSCRAEECCEPLDQCDANDCGVGFIAKSSQPAFCNGVSCTREECCDQQGVCRLEHCDEGWVVQANPPDFCETQNCTNQECCHKAQPCWPGDCRYGFRLKESHLLPTLCSNAPCTWQECCFALGKCENQTVCNAEHVLKGPISMPEYCAGLICTQAECCTPKARCHSAICSDGWVPKSWISYDGMPRMCAGRYCTVDECCEQAGECDATLCLMEGPGFTLRSTSADVLYCNRTRCEHEDCCVPYGSCETWTDSDCGPGFGLKTTFPEHCSTSTCARSECCEPGGKCSDISCGTGGFAPKLNPVPGYNCSTRVCTPEECCDRVPESEEESDPLPFILVAALIVVVSVVVVLCCCCCYQRRQNRIRAKKARDKQRAFGVYTDDKKGLVVHRPDAWGMQVVESAP